MQFYLDTADILEIKEASKAGWLDGVTTNPSLIAKTGRPQAEVIKEITACVTGYVSAEVLSVDFKGMVQEGLELSKIAKNVVVKIPMTDEGLKAVVELTSLGIRTNVTLVFSPLQALLAAKAGATLMSPFVGRLDDVGQDGMDMLSQIVEIYRNYNFETKILAASLRHPNHVLHAALVGADIVTIPMDVLKKLSKHPLTDKGLEQFLKDAGKK